MNDCHGNSFDLLRPDAAYMCTQMNCVDSAAALSGLTEKHNALMMYKKTIIWVECNSGKNLSDTRKSHEAYESMHIKKEKDNKTPKHACKPYWTYFTVSWSIPPAHNMK